MRAIVKYRYTVIDWERTLPTQATNVQRTSATLAPSAVNPHAPLPASPFAMFESAWHNRHLILQMTRREVLSRYRGSAMGLAWSFFHPLLMLLVYTFVFSVILKARWGLGNDESKVDFAIILFVGLIVHGLFAECLNRSPNLILSNVVYVKKVVFPLEILAWIALGSALFHAAISLLVLLAAKVVVGQGLDYTVLLVPVVFVPLLLGTLGLTWIGASLGVYLRDLGQVMGIITTTLLFLSPIFYPLSTIPQEYRMFIMLNPLTFSIEQARRVLIWGMQPEWAGLGLYTLASITMACVGFWWFQKTRRGFADVV